MKSIREQFGQTLSELAKKNKKIVAISCDLMSACKLNLFAKKFPKRFIEVGIAEANGIVPPITDLSVFTYASIPLISNGNT